MNWAGLARTLSGIGIATLIFIIDFTNMYHLTALTLIVISNAMLVVISPTTVENWEDV
jgi:hypothetical protein